ncbi:MAG: hypothetical protein ACREI3_04725, partial [Nitrospirales bacterium]
MRQLQPCVSTGREGGSGTERARLLEVEKLASDQAERTADRVRLVLEAIRQAARRAGRAPESVRLVAATKFVPLATIQAAMAAGLTHLGESRVQEALQRLAALAERRDLTWHFIGRLQRRKVRSVVGRFHLIHSLDSLE